MVKNITSAVDSETKFILAFHLTKSRTSDSAYTLINEAKNYGKPMTL